MVDAGTAVHRAQERQRLIGGHRAVALRDQPETVFDIASGDGVDRAGAPVAKIEAGIAAIGTLGLRRPVMARIDIVVARLAQRGQGARLGALARRILAAGDAPEQFLRLAPGLFGGDSAKASDDDPLVGRLAAAVARAVVDDEGLGAGGLDAAAEADQFVVPCDPGLVGGLECVDGVCQSAFEV